jgi:hypothetical protein
MANVIEIAKPQSPHTTKRTGARRRTCWLPTRCTTKREPTVASRATAISSTPFRAGPNPAGEVFRQKRPDRPIHHPDVANEDENDEEIAISIRPKSAKGGSVDCFDPNRSRAPTAAPRRTRSAPKRGASCRTTRNSFTPWPRERICGRSWWP